MWTKNPTTRDLKAKLGYKNWDLEHYQGERNSWWKQVWKIEGPIKDKITLWLALRNKLLHERILKIEVYVVQDGVFYATRKRKQDLTCFLFVLVQKKSGRKLAKS